MTSGKQTVQNVYTIYWGEKFYGPLKKGIHTCNNFTDKNQFKPMTKSIAEVGIIWTLNDTRGC